MQAEVITPNQKQSLQLAIAALRALKTRQSYPIIVNRAIDNLTLILESNDDE